LTVVFELSAHIFTTVQTFTGLGETDDGKIRWRLISFEFEVVCTKS